MSTEKISRAEHAYQKLIESIHSGELKPGSRIRETEIAEWLQISRTPIREALLRLESEGLLCTAPRKGLIVSELDYQAVMELYQMREVLEATAAGLAAKHASEAEIYALKEMISQQKTSLGDTRTQSAQNRDFHNALYHAAHNRYLLRSLNSLRDAMSLLGKTTYEVPDRDKTACEEHERLVAAIEKGDIESAEHHAREHIKSAQRARIQLINTGRNV